MTKTRLEVLIRLKLWIKSRLVGRGSMGMVPINQIRQGYSG